MNIQPIDLNLFLNKTPGGTQVELSKRILITDDVKPLWRKIFTLSLTKDNFLIPARIKYRDKLLSKVKFKEAGLLDPKVSIEVIPIPKKGIFDEILTTVKSPEFQKYAEASKKFIESEDMLK